MALKKGPREKEKKKKKMGLVLKRVLPRCPAPDS